MTTTELDILSAAANNDHVLGKAYPQPKSTSHMRLRRRGLLKLEFGTTAYSLWSITDAGRAALNNVKGRK